MDVVIQEKSFSFGVQYDIHTPTQELQALKAILSMLPHITLQTKNDVVLAKIVGESFFRTKFSISLSNGSVYHYHCEKIWKSVDICEGTGGPFHLYSHHGNRFSVLQGETQIAALSRNKVVVGNGKKFELRVNSDANLPLIISMVLCLNTEDGDDREDNTVTIDFGNVGPEDRKFDESWQPNDATAAS